jgi:hypothetical protein
MLIKLLTLLVIKEIELANLNAQMVGFRKTLRVYVCRIAPLINLQTLILVVVSLLVTV